MIGFLEDERVRIRGVQRAADGTDELLPQVAPEAE